MGFDYEISSDGLNYFWSSMFDCLKPKIRCLSLITKERTYSGSFDVWKVEVWVCSMSNFVNLVPIMFDVCSFEAKNRVLEFDCQ